jgi:hypothetical protein
VIGPLCEGDEDAGAFSGARLGANCDFDVAVESGQEVHQAFDGEYFEAVVCEGRNFWVVDFEAPCGGCFRKGSADDDLTDSKLCRIYGA